MANIYEVGRHVEVGDISLGGSGVMTYSSNSSQVFPAGAIITGIRMKGDNAYGSTISYSSLGANLYARIGTISVGSIDITNIPSSTKLANMSLISDGGMYIVSSGSLNIYATAVSVSGTSTATDQAMTLSGQHDYYVDYIIPAT